jgi:4-diphosphocytidyl-2-C-methyl-D-erythritol kinase
MLAPFSFMRLIRRSPCKINLLLNILGRRPDGFHDLETVFQPVNLCDELEFEQGGPGVAMTCNHPELPTDASNLVVRAAVAFFEKAQLRAGVRIHLKKQIPLAAGLGGGSSNAAATLQGLNELFGEPLAMPQLELVAAQLGSDVPFFLQPKPALGLGRGERIEPLDFFPALHGAFVLLIHPGFGVSTAWAYQQLVRFPTALNGQPGRAQRLVELLQSADLTAAAPAFYNSLEAPVLEKYPLLAMFQEQLREQGAQATLMSGSGSTTFALAADRQAGEALRYRFQSKFGESHWTAVVGIEPGAIAQKQD